MTYRFLLIWLCATTFLGSTSRAAEGPAQGPPRFASSSDLFELVGVADGKFITLYLDRFANNEPVRRATIDLEVGGARVAVEEVAPGEYEGALAETLQPGVTAVTATISVGAETDLFAGDLTTPDALTTDPAAGGAGRFARWGAVAAVFLALLGLGLRRFAARRIASGGAA